MTAMIRLDGEIVAFVGATRAFLAPAIQQLDDASPKRRLALLMCEHALTNRPYDPRAAEAYARSRVGTDDHSE